MTTTQIKLPPKLVDVFSSPRGNLRFRGAYGGRGSGKSLSFAIMAATFGYVEKLRILCTREFQNSLDDSFFAEVRNAIEMHPFLEQGYEIGRNFIRGKNGTEFIFAGLRNNINSLKSKANIDICIVEEAEDVPEYSWIKLIPTIRAKKSEIWVLWNPEKRISPTDYRFRVNNPPRSKIVELNYRDNPAFPSVLEEERLSNKETMDTEKYNWIWEGGYYENKESNIFKGKWIIDEFTPQFDWDGPYQGLDFGFSNDPTAAVKCWIYDNTIFVEHEAGKIKLELDDTTGYICSSIPDFENHKIIADSARPESISFLARNGLPYITGTVKGKGSVEDGIDHLKSYKKIVVHPRCKETINELKNYSYKIDRHTGEVTRDIVDLYNHYIDAIRYAFEPVMHNKSRCGFLDLL